VPGRACSEPWTQRPSPVCTHSVCLLSVSCLPLLASEMFTSVAPLGASTAAASSLTPPHYVEGVAVNGQGQATQSWAGSHLTCAFRGIRPAAPRLYHRFKRPARDTNTRGRIRGTLPSCLSDFAPANYPFPPRDIPHLWGCCERARCARTRCVIPSAFE